MSVYNFPMKAVLKLVQSDPRYLKNIEFSPADEAHPEGKIKNHIADLESNLDALRAKGVSEEQYWKLKFMIHVHDLFKSEARRGVPPTHPENHAYLARRFAAEFVNDSDLLNMIQFHDENYKLWREYEKAGFYDELRFQRLLNAILDWDLFLMFLIVDGCTRGKDPSKLYWFIGEVEKRKKTRVNSSWVLSIPDLRSE